MTLHTTEINNSQDLIDSRDVIGRIQYLEIDENELDDDEKEELRILRDLAEQGEQYSSNWINGSTLIADDYFVQYARDLAEDIGAISRNLDWPACHIDWEAAANYLKMDYSSIDFDGAEYWVRSY